MSISSYSDSLSSFSFNSDEFSASREKDPSSESLSWEESESSSEYDSELSADSLSSSEHSDKSTSKSKNISNGVLTRELKDKLRSKRAIKKPIVFDEIVDTTQKSHRVAKETFFQKFEKAIDLFDTNPQKVVRYLETFVENKEEKDFAKLGMAWSLLGNAYKNGIGADQDLERAEKAYLKAYQFGVDVSEYKLGTIYETEEYYKKNLDHAKKYYQNYIKNGGWAGNYKMGMLLLNEGKTKQADKYFQACIKGSENENDSTILKDFEDHVLESKKQLQRQAPTAHSSESIESDQYGNEKMTPPAPNVFEEFFNINVVQDPQKSPRKAPKTLKRRLENPSNQQLPPKKRKFNPPASSITQPISIAAFSSEEQEMRLKNRLDSDFALNSKSFSSQDRLSHAESNHVPPESEEGIVQGTLHFPSGARYEGEILNGKAHGRGKYFTKGKLRFMGRFIHGYPLGKPTKLK